MDLQTDYKSVIDQKQKRKKSILYIECTNTFSSPISTGIQRVVKEIIRNLFLQENLISGFIDENIKNLKLGIYDDKIVKTIIFKNGRFIEVDPDFVNQRTNHQNNFKNGIKIKIKKIINNNSLNQAILIRKTMSFILNKIFILKSNVQMILTKLHLIGRHDVQVNLQSGDQLLLLDSTWDKNIWDQLGIFKKQGAEIYSVIYDLIPIIYPELAEKNTIVVYNSYFKNSINIVDKYICISKTVAQELEEYFVFLQLKKIPKVGSFKLGADFKIINNISVLKIDERIKNIFSNQSKVFIQIGTLEPRKNHIYSLNAFEKLWSDGHDVKLCFIGRIGWKVEDLIKKIQSHPQYNNKLIMLNDIDDSVMDYCMNKANVLLFPSIVEGYGLPIIEGLNKNMTVFASNTRIHQEVGGAYVNYFELDNDNSLVDLIKKYLSNPDSFKKETKGLKPISWKCSAELLIKEMSLD